MKALIIISLLSLASCAHISNLNQEDFKTYFPNADIVTAQASQPDNVTCPKCKSEGNYIQSLILDTPSLFYSQYVCQKSHMWFIGQEVVEGPIKQIIIVK